MKKRQFMGLVQIRREGGWSPLVSHPREQLCINKYLWDCFKLGSVSNFPVSVFNLPRGLQQITGLTFQQITAALRCHCCPIPQPPGAVFMDMAKKPGNLELAK